MSESGLSPQRAPPLDHHVGEPLAPLRTRYEWTGNNEHVPGVPMLARVPEEEEPDGAWSVSFARAVLEIACNQVLVKLGGIGSAAPAVRKDLDQARAAIDFWSRGANGAASYSDAGRSAAFSSLLPHLRRLREIITSHALNASQAARAADWKQIAPDFSAHLALDPVTEDERFAWLRLAGPNPGKIRAWHAVPDRFGIDDACFRQVMGAQDSLAQAAAERRLFGLDYAELRGITINRNGGQARQLIAAMALFSVPKNGGELQPVAIQLGQNGHRDRLIARPPATSNDQSDWRFAKRAIQVADTNDQFLFAHLARTHLVMEACAVATHRCLRPNHPVYRLLLPHLEGTVFINQHLVRDLLAQDGPINQWFAGTVLSTRHSIVSERLAFDFRAQEPVREFSERGVSESTILSDYPYRDDSLLLWSAITEWVADYVEVYFASDHSVRHDQELNAWRWELLGDGRLDIGALDGRADLIEVLALMLFTASVQHAAVHAPQRPYLADAREFGGALWRATQVQAGIDSSFPPLPEAQAQFNLFSLLGSVHRGVLGDYRDPGARQREWFADPKISRGPLPRLRARLQEIEVEIDQRNLRRRMPYPFLKPSQIAASIHI